ncbi:MAG: hypothetical protein OXC55_02520 [Chloroflexi bacterium]|nr:hypothetical protein [Chloroflexota bacterium]
MSLPVGVSSACSVMDTTRTPLRRSMDLKATACSRLRVKRENFQTRISVNGASGAVAASIIFLNSGRSAMRPLSASSMYSRTTICPFFAAKSRSARNCAATDRSTSCLSLDTRA